MNVIHFLLLSAGLGAAGAAMASAQPVTMAERPPNFLVFLCDNLGYGDIGPYGSTLHRTPNLDALAREGRRFTHFYTAANVCTPSRAGLMTGTYPRRLNIYMSASHRAVPQPGEPIGLNPAEVTLAEVLKSVGYATMLVGKWHLGDQPVFLPTRQGFDEYWGVPYSDNMTPRQGTNWPPLPLMRDETVIEAGVDRNELTQRETREAIRFITTHRDRPFFLMVSHAMPGSTHAPFASAAFRGKSRNGPYGDAIEELDWSAGEILRTLRRLGLDDNTMVIWTSDNAAQRSKPQRGTNAPLTGFMHTPAEGGMRVPFMARYPGRIPAGSVTEELATMMDLLPTFAFLAGAKAPGKEVIDGHNIWPLLAGLPGARTPYEAFYYYQFEQLQAVRSGEWKLYVPLERRRGASSAPTQEARFPARLYNVVNDGAETDDLAAQHPEVIERLQCLAERARVEIGDLDQPGRGERPAGWVFQPQVQRLQMATSP